MEFVEGEDLDRTVRESRALPIGQTLRRGVIHRDFKPTNVLLTERGIPKIADFGLAKLAQSSLHIGEGWFLGSPPYIRSEQAADKEPDARLDIYSFGVTLYKMLTGRLPFEGEVESVIAQNLTKEPVPLPELNEHISESLNRLVLQMRAKELDTRPANMEAVAEVLKGVTNAPDASSTKWVQNRPVSDGNPLDA